MNSTLRHYRVKFRSAALIVGFAALLTGCSSVPIDTYADNQPQFDLTHYFDGNLTAHGIIKSRSGQVTRYFNVTITGEWDSDGVGTLTEDFICDDGERQQRVWVMTPDGDNNYWAVAGDVKEPAKMALAGNALFMKYQLLIPYKNRNIYLTVDDRMYAVDEATIINESKLSKFGINLGSIKLVIIKKD